MSSSPPSLKPDVTLSLTLSSPNSDYHTIKPEERGIKLIQLLLSCANHTSSGNLQHADECLHKISGLASVSGDSMQRLAARFASALAVRLVRRWTGLYKALNHVRLTSAEMDRARSIYAQAFPYLGFGYAIIARVLLQSMSQERVVHIVDLGSGDPKLWVPLLRSFAKTAYGPPPHMKITCVHNNKVVLDKLGAKLIKEADSLDLPFQFNPVNVSLRDLTIDMLNIRSGESLAFTSILNLHTLLANDDRLNARFGFDKNDGDKDSKQINEFLVMLRSTLPKVLLLIEQEAEHNLNRLVDRFVEGLHYYSALFDSIDATFEGSSPEERVIVEEMFGKEIEDIVAYDGLEREERHEKYTKWTARFSRAGFGPTRLWHAIAEDAKRLVEAYGLDGYKIISQKASLMICWHDRPIYSVSAWNCFN